MSDLKPCPFCGSGWLYETRRNGYCDETPTMFCNSCKAVVTWEQVEEEGVNDKTKAFVREHWNSRAERVTDDEWESYQHSIPATEENMAKFGWVRERTCRNLDKHHNIMFKCSECGHWECQDFDGEKILPQTWNYCPNCGCKVVDK